MFIIRGKITKFGGHDAHFFYVLSLINKLTMLFQYKNSGKPLFRSPTFIATFVANYQ